MGTPRRASTPHALPRERERERERARRRGPSLVRLSSLVVSRLSVALSRDAATCDGAREGLELYHVAGTGLETVCGVVHSHAPAPFAERIASRPSFPAFFDLVVIERFSDKTPPTVRLVSQLSRSSKVSYTQSHPLSLSPSKLNGIQIDPLDVRRREQRADHERAFYHLPFISSSSKRLLLLLSLSERI